MHSKNKNKNTILILILVIFGVLGLFLISAANNPVGPDSLNITSNTTKPAVINASITISGGYVAIMNVTTTTQDSRWKAFVGTVTGMFSLQDGSGSTIYDWRLSSITGSIYTTRNASLVSWVNINCSNITTLNQENYLINHTNINDNLTATFNLSEAATHQSFYVGAKYIANNTCPTLNTYKSSVPQDTDFDEMALYDGYNIIYATIINQNQVGYNGAHYDFQMIVPENGASGFQGATAYYLYVEI
jgi:hypothetical protein